MKRRAHTGRMVGMGMACALVHLASVPKAPGRVVRTAPMTVGASSASTVTAASVGASPMASVQRPSRSRLRALSPDGRRIAEVRVHGRAGEALWLDGEKVWGGKSIASAVVWSRRGDALAFVSRDHAVAQLVVVLAPRGGDAQAMTWPIPQEAGPTRAVTWLGESKVGAGPAVLDPKVIATWQSTEAR